MAHKRDKESSASKQEGTPFCGAEVQNYPLTPPTWESVLHTALSDLSLWGIAVIITIAGYFVFTLTKNENQQSATSPQLTSAEVEGFVVLQERMKLLEGILERAADQSVKAENGTPLGWNDFADDLITTGSHLGISSLLSAELVSAKQREQLAEQLQTRGWNSVPEYEGFAVHPPVLDKHLAAFVVTLAAPLHSDASLLGYNLWESEEMRLTIKKAIAQRGSFLLSSGFKVKSESSDKPLWYLGKVVISSDLEKVIPPRVAATEKQIKVVLLGFSPEVAFPLQLIGKERLVQLADSDKKHHLTLPKETNHALFDNARLQVGLTFLGSKWGVAANGIALPSSTESKGPLVRVPPLVLIAFVGVILFALILLKVFSSIRREQQQLFILGQNAQLIGARQAQLRALMESYPLGTFVTRSSGKLVYGNAEFLRLVATAPADLSSLNWTSLVTPEDRARIEAAWSDALRLETHLDLICQLTVGGKPFWVRVRTSPVRSRDKFVGYMGILEDVTTRHEDEALLSVLTAELSNARAAFKGACDTLTQAKRVVVDDEESTEIIDRSQMVVTKVSSEIDEVVAIINQFASAMQGGVVSGDQCDTTLLALRRNSRKMQNAMKALGRGDRQKTPAASKRSERI